MSEFGWAYVVGSQAGGVSGSVQTARPDLGLTGSQQLIYDHITDTLTLSGSMFISGSITANQYNVNVVNETVTNISASGNTKFGNTTDDLHIFTGSLSLSGTANPLKIEGLYVGTKANESSYLALDANRNLVKTTISYPVTALNNQVANRLVSIGSTTTELDGEANLTFDGSTMVVTGDMSASVGLSSSVGQFTELTGSRIKGTTIDVTTATATTVNATTVTATNLGGTLTTVAQPNVTSVGTLTGLTVSGDVNVDSNTLFVNSSTNKIGLGFNDPVKTLEISSSAEQLRLTYQRNTGIGFSDKHTDIYTNQDGYLVLNPSHNRVGIGTTSPKKMLDVDGNVRIGGNLEVTGTFSAHVTDFIVGANSLTLGDSASDSLTINSTAVTIPNDLNFDSNTLFLDSTNNRVGVGTDSPETPLHIQNGSAGSITATDGAVLVLESNEKPKIHFQSPNAYGGSIIFGSPTDDDEGQIDYDHGSDRFLFKTGGSTKMSILGNNVGVGTSAPEKKLHVVGDTIITGDLGVTGSITGNTLTDGSAVITGGNISNVGTVTATNLAGTLTTAAQANVTSVGTLTGLTVSGDVNVDSNTLFVNSSTNKVGMGYSDPVKALEVSSSSEQLRLTYQRNIGIGYADKHTDIYTNKDGYLILSSSHNRTGIGTTNPKKMLDVDGNVRIGGNLEITGTLSARVTDFKVQADTIILGDTISDTVIFNAATGTIMNGLNWDGNTFVMNSDQNRIGIGVAHPTARLHVSSSSQTLLKLNGSDFTITPAGDLTIKPSGDYLTASSGLKVSGSSNLGTLSTQHTVVSGHLSASVAVSSSSGRFTNLDIDSLTDGVATIVGGNISSVGTLTATSVNATITKAAQANITSVGTLTGLTVSGDLNVDSNVLFVNSTTNKVGLGYNNPVKALEVSSSAEQLRLTYQRNVGIGYADKHTDIYTNSDGYLLLSASHARVGVNVVSPTATLEVGGDTKINGGLKVTGLALGAGVTTKYLALDAGNNIVLTSSVAPGIETRNRRKITGNTNLAEDDYYIGVSASADVVVTLPNASILSNGQTFTIKDERGNAGDIQLKITASAEHLIDGEPLIFIESPYGSINIYTDGSTNYFIF